MPGAPAEFPVTRWSHVLYVRGDPACPRDALATRLRLDWPPLDAFLLADAETSGDARVLAARRWQTASRIPACAERPRPRAHAPPGTGC
jgi:hypothetical protein